MIITWLFHNSTCDPLRLRNKARSVFWWSDWASFSGKQQCQLVQSPHCPVCWPNVRTQMALQYGSPQSPHSERKRALSTCSTRGRSFCKCEGTFTEMKRLVSQTRFGPGVDGRANIQSGRTNRRGDLKLRHPGLLHFPANGHNSISLQAVQPNPSLSAAGCNTATVLHGVCECVCPRRHGA